MQRVCLVFAVILFCNCEVPRLTLAMEPAVANPQPAEEASKRLQRITDGIEQAQQSFMESLKSGKPTMALIRTAGKERTEKLKALAAELAAIGPENHGLGEHQTLADLYVKIHDWDAAIQHAQSAIAMEANLPSTQANLVIALIEKGKLEEAERAFASALSICDDKTLLLPLHHRLYLANRKANKPLSAAEHLSCFLTTFRPFSGTTNKVSYLRNLNDLTAAYADADQGTKGLERIDEELSLWDAVAGADAAMAQGVAAQVRARKIQYLAQLGEQAEAEALLRAQNAEAQKTLAENPDDVQAILRMAWLLESATVIAEGEQKDSTRHTWLAFLADQFAKHTDSPEIASAMGSAYASQIQQLSRDDKGDVAEKLASEFQASLALAPADSPTRKSLAISDSIIKSQIRRLVTQRLQGELIGKPMIPLDVAAWVNGSPLAAEDLKGKVVLLDFWAVWCGPCRATFPHLTEWHEKLEKDGLVIIGLTRYHQYGWDAEAMQSTQVENLTPEAEAAALEPFVKHHGLKHRLAFIPKESSLSASYGVSGIPHVVVIDRNGVIRMIRVGSGEKNAHDIATLLEELVHGPPRERPAGKPAA